MKKLLFIFFQKGTMRKNREGSRSEILKLANPTQLMAKDLLTIANRNDVK